MPATDPEEPTVPPTTTDAPQQTAGAAAGMERGTARRPEDDRQATTLSLPPYLLHALRVTAAHAGLSLSGLVAQALHDRLPDEELVRAYQARGGTGSPPYPAGTR